MSTAPFLLIDAGNSRIKWSLAAPDGAMLGGGVFGHTHGHTHVHTHADDTSDPDWTGLPRPSGAWVSNVAGDAVGARIDALIDAHWPGLARATVRAQARQCGVINGYDEPAKLGSDRWSGLIGARAAFPGEHLLIATFGTATTLEALRADGVFTGGLIAPGWSLMMQSLGTSTAHLPTLDADSARRALASDASDASLAKPSMFATGTRAALSSGCLLAQAGLIERAWRELKDERKTDVRLVLGGGAANEIASVLTVPHTRHDSLVLSGLSLIARDASTRNLS